MVKTSTSSAGGAELIPVQLTKMPHALWPKNQNVKQKQYCNKFNKDFKKWSTLRKKQQPSISWRVFCIYTKKPAALRKKAYKAYICTQAHTLPLQLLSSFHLFVHSCNKLLLNGYYISGMVQGWTPGHCLRKRSSCCCC